MAGDLSTTPDEVRLTDILTIYGRSAYLLDSCFHYPCVPVPALWEPPSDAPHERGVLLPAGLVELARVQRAVELAGGEPHKPGAKRRAAFVQAVQ